MEEFNKDSVFDKNQIESEDSFKQKIKAIAEGIYAKDPDHNNWEYQCLRFSDLMYEKLVEMGIPKKEIIRMQADVSKLAEKNTKPHYFLKAMNYFICGTWQQFLDKPLNTNHCLVLNEDHLNEDLKAAGVPVELWFIFKRGYPTNPALKDKEIY